MVRQPHGGALLQGGRLGNKGGSGRPPDEFRRLARELLAERSLLPRLADIAQGKIGEIVELGEGRIFCETPIKEQRQAIAELARIGVPVLREVSREDVMVRLRATIELIRDRLAGEAAEELLREMEGIWK